MTTLIKILLAFSFLLVSCTDKKHDQLVVAKVNSDILSAKDFANLLIKKIHNFSSIDLKSDKDLILIKLKIVDDFILDSISNHWAKEKKIIITTKEVNKKQYLIPYFISAHPGSTDKDMLNLALWLKENNFKVDQVQNFYPSQLATASTMFATERNPLK